MQAVNVRIIQVVLLVAILGGWQLGVTSGAIDRFFFPAPYDIVQQVISWVTDPGFYKHVGITLSETVLGYMIGTGLGVGAGVWLGLSPYVARILDPFIKAVNAIPRVVLAPIFVLWLGLGLWSKVALAVTLVFFVTFFKRHAGCARGEPGRAIEYPYPRRQALRSAASCLLSGCCDLDLIVAAHIRRLCRRRRNHRRISRSLRRSRLSDCPFGR
ncbi:ABC-type nitrate/sulfonate/bicarbonate transport system permease component [Rhizobium pisi]